LSSAGVTPDYKSPDTNLLTVMQGGLGLTGEDFDRFRVDFDRFIRPSYASDTDYHNKFGDFKEYLIS